VSSSSKGEAVLSFGNVRVPRKLLFFWGGHSVGKRVEPSVLCARSRVGRLSRASCVLLRWGCPAEQRTQAMMQNNVVKAVGVRRGERESSRKVTSEWSFGRGVKLSSTG
jgi:hypothetical protein